MARTPSKLLSVGLILAATMSAGCRSPYHSDQGALFGGLLGAGTGAIIGGATGHPGAGAAIGAGVGALSGAAIGNAQDEMEAHNRAIIAQQLGRQVAPGAVSVDDVIAMTKSGVKEDLISTHVQKNHMIAPLQTGDLIRLQQEGVSPNVIAAMQSSPPRLVQPVVYEQSPPPAVIVEEYRYPPPYYGPHYYPHAYYRWH